MKKVMLSIAMATLALTSKAAEHKLWDWNVAPVYSVKVSDFQFSSHESGGGVQGELFVAKNVSLQLQGVTYNVNHSFIDEASAGFNWYVPVGNVFSLVGHLGALRDTEAESWNYKLGAGIQADISKNVAAHVGGYIVDDFHQRPELRFETAVKFLF
jgi:hypothetical protein